MELETGRGGEGVKRTRDQWLNGVKETIWRYREWKGLWRGLSDRIWKIQRKGGCHAIGVGRRAEGRFIIKCVG